VFYNGKLEDKEIGAYPVNLMPKTEPLSAEKIRWGMTYQEVFDVLGVEGYLIEDEIEHYDEGGFMIHDERPYYKDQAVQKYTWRLADNIAYSNYLEITFTDGVIKNHYNIVMNLP